MPEIQTVSYTHEALIDQLIAQPWTSQNEIAAHFGYTAAWISTIMQSDAFQAKLAERREAIIDPALRLSVEERFRGVIARSMEVLQEKLSLPYHMVSDEVALRAADMGAKYMVAQVKNQQPPRPPVGDRLAELAQRLTALQPGGLIIEQETRTE